MSAAVYNGIQRDSEKAWAKAPSHDEFLKRFVMDLNPDPKTLGVRPK
jgi:hypothetical protein